MPSEPEIQPAASPEMTAQLHQQREHSRRSLLRANTAVGFALLVVVGLACIAVWLSLRATRLGDQAQRGQQRAEQAEATARSELWHAYLSEAKAVRLGDTIDRSRSALQLIQQASKIAPARELQKEAVAALALPSFPLESSIPFPSATTAYEFDLALTQCAVGLTNQEVVIYSLKDGSETMRLKLAEAHLPEDQGNPLLMEFSKDGGQLNVRYRGGGLVVWDLGTRQIRFQHDADKHRGATSRGRFSSDGRFIVGPVRTPNDGIAVYEIASGHEVAFYPEYSSFRHVSVRPLSTMFAVNDGTHVVVIDWTKKQHIEELPFEGGVRGTAWSQDGRKLAIVGSLLEAHVWDLETRQLTVLPGYKSDISTPAFDPTGEKLATTCTDGSSQLWDLREKRLLGTTTEGHIVKWGTGDRVGWERHGASLEVRRLSPSTIYRRMTAPINRSDPARLDITPDGNWAVSAIKRDGLWIWNLQQGAAPSWTPMVGIYSLCFHPNEPIAWFTGRGGAEMRSYQIASNVAGARLEFGPPTKMRAVPGRKVNLVTSSPDGNRLAWVELGAGKSWTDPWRQEAVPQPMDAIAFNSTADEWSSPRGGGSMSFSPDGRWIAYGRGGGQAQRVCNSLTGELIARLGVKEADVQFSPDGRWLVAAGGDECSLYRTTDWSRVWTYRQERFYLRACAAFSPDSATVAVAKPPHSTVLLDAATGRELNELEAPIPSPITSIRWAVANRLVLATRENQIDLWELAPLRQQLNALGLGKDANEPASTLLAHSLPQPVDMRSAGSTAWIAALVLLTVGLVAVIALLSLQRHRRLIEDYMRTEALASQRGRELEGEREVSRLKSSFVSMVSHEFRTPLGIIQSSAQILDRYLEKLAVDQRREQLGSITHNVRRMSSLIDEVLLLGKVEAGQMRFTPEFLSLEDFCRRLVDEMASATNARCPISLATDPMPLAFADESLLRHILGNLISNAVKYSPPGTSVQLRIRREGSMAIIDVTDSGLGIPQPDLERLFTAFHRGGNVGQIGGTGLGLTIVKRCVLLHGGDISVESEVGKGSTFTARIPLFDQKPSNHPSPL